MYVGLPVNVLSLYAVSSCELSNIISMRQNERTTVYKFYKFWSTRNCDRMPKQRELNIDTCRGASSRKLPDEEYSLIGGELSLAKQRLNRKAIYTYTRGKSWDIHVFYLLVILLTNKAGLYQLLLWGNHLMPRIPEENSLLCCIPASSQFCLRLHSIPCYMPQTSSVYSHTHSGDHMTDISIIMNIV